MIECEEGWLSCRSPHLLLAYLENRTSARKLRLFACALARRHECLLRDSRSRAALETGERLAEGARVDLELLRDDAQMAALYAPQFQAPAHAVAAATVAEVPLEAAQTALHASRQQAERDARYACVSPRDEAEGVAEALARETAVQCELVHHIFGNPFRRPQIDPALRYWHDGLIVRIARLIYEERQDEDMPLLADALTDAGCLDDDLLAHCRLPIRHPRGCWALDALLERS